MTEVDRHRAQKIAEDLIGTAQSEHHVATEREANDENFMAVVYEYAFVCDCCGWWASVDELNNLTDDDLCDECHDDS